MIAGSSWDETADVVVVGFGAAGVAAALSAAESGADVLVLEKQPEHAHTPTAKAAGAFVMSVVDAVPGTEYLDCCAGDATPRSVSAAWAERASTLHDWLLERCPGLTAHDPATMHGRAAHPQLPGAHAIRTRLYSAPSGGRRPGTELFEALSAALSRRTSVRVRWEHRGRRLLLDEGSIRGIEVEAPDGVRRVQARCGVVLTTGGFEYDEELKLQYLQASPLYFAGNPGNTGDGLRMALAAGSDLWHMNLAEGRQVGHFVEGARELNFQMAFGPPGGYVVLDRYGERFCDEHAYTQIHTFWYELAAYDAKRREYSRIPSYWLFDSTRFESGPLTYSAVGPVALDLYEWSADNHKELGKGWISVGDTPGAAAAAAGVVDSDQADRSVAAYNRSAAHGRDPFCRPADSLTPLNRPPYYCVPLYPGGIGTAGGPRHDERGRVLDPFGDVIPGLYSAGSVGQMLGKLYPAPGSGWSEALCAGRLAGESAATARG